MCDGKNERVEYLVYKYITLLGPKVLEQCKRLILTFAQKKLEINKAKI